MFKKTEEKKNSISKIKSTAPNKKNYFYISDHIYQTDLKLFKKEDNLKIDEMRTELHVKVQ